MEDDLDKALNMKLVLCLFEQLSGLKINFHKSEFFVLEMLKILRRNIKTFLDAVLDPYLSDIWGIQFIFEN
jgi:hypothetical protein